jgi:hypothetical protein
LTEAALCVPFMAQSYVVSASSCKVKVNGHHKMGGLLTYIFIFASCFGVVPVTGGVGCNARPASVPARNKDETAIFTSTAYFNCCHICLFLESNQNIFHGSKR